MPGHDGLPGRSGQPEPRQPGGPPQEGARAGGGVPRPLAWCAAVSMTACVMHYCNVNALRVLMPGVRLIGHVG